MEMPEGWKRLCWYRDGFKERDLPSMALTFTEAADLMKEMAEIIDRMTAPSVIAFDRDTVIKVLNKFKEWK